jgi:hypothetical protein
MYREKMKLEQRIPRTHIQQTTCKAAIRFSMETLKLLNRTRHTARNNIKVKQMKTRRT